MLSMNHILPETETITNERAEMAAQLRKYADSITAFSFLQGAAFCFALGNGGELLKGVEECPFIVFLLLLFAAGGYLFGVFLCHKGEDELVGAPDTRDALGRWNGRVRFARMVLVVLSASLSIAAMIAKTKMSPLSCPVTHSSPDIR